jgi:hypothetical protein
LFRCLLARLQLRLPRVVRSVQGRLKDGRHPGRGGGGAQASFAKAADQQAGDTGTSSAQRDRGRVGHGLSSIMHYVRLAK